MRLPDCHGLPLCLLALIERGVEPVDQVPEPRWQGGLERLVVYVREFPPKPAEKHGVAARLKRGVMGEGDFAAGPHAK